MTKKETMMLEKYNNATDTELWEVYGSFSASKARSYENIKNECYENGGYGLYITGACSTNYSCAYKIDKEGKTFLVYHTFKNRFEFAI